MKATNELAKNHWYRKFDEGYRFTPIASHPEHDVKFYYGVTFEEVEIFKGELVAQDYEVDIHAIRTLMEIENAPQYRKNIE